MYLAESRPCSLNGYDSGFETASFIQSVSDPASEGHGEEMVPSVTLSPKARNFTFSSSGRTETFTAKVQLAVRASASVAVQLTVLVPRLNEDPGAGAQATVTGVAPFAAAGTA